MTTGPCPRILRNYRNLPATRFHEFNQRTKTSLLDKTRFPDSFWGHNLPLIQAYFSASDKHDAVYHESMLGSKLVIAEREGLQAQLVLYLDQIAALLEMMAVCNPGILLAAGFELAKERRGHARAKATAAARNAVGAESADGDGGTPA